MAPRGLAVTFALALLCLPSSALARGGHGGGHCGGGHGGGHHAGAGHGAGWHGASGHGSRAISHASTVPLMSRPFPWEPAPFAVTGGQFMQCSGQTIAPGADPRSVRRACGEPALLRQSLKTTPTGPRTVEIWSYARPNQITRNLRFENGVVSSIETVHRANR